MTGGSLLRRLTAALVAVAAVVAMTGCDPVASIPLPGGVNVGSNPITVHVMFRDVLDLVPQSTVKVDDVTVGRVTAIKLKGYTADVTIKVPRSAKIDADATAEIRQTSLLGEKFVSIANPSSGSSTLLTTGDTIPLSRTGRNPEVEEVLNALALLLNGGGVGQLKTIADELNTAVGGRESDIRSIITQIRTFTGQLDANKAQIVQALENVNRLSVQLHKQDGTIKSTLDDLPAALKSINGQRADLVKTLQALSKLSNVGVRVIKESKAATIDTFQQLSPVLSQLAKAGQNLPKSLNVILTYPFVDAAVGDNPTVARNLHLGDFVNLNARLDLNLNNLSSGKVGAACKTAKQETIADIDKLVDQLPPGLVTNKAALKKDLANSVNALDCDQLTVDPSKLATSLLAAALKDLSVTAPVGSTVCKLLPALCTAINNPPSGGSPIPPLGGLGGGPGGLGGLGGGGLGLDKAGLGRPAPGAPSGTSAEPDPFGIAKYGYDPGIGTLLLQGVAETS